VSGHIPAGMWAEDVVEAGFDEIQHANMLFLNFYKDVENIDTPARFHRVAERGVDMDFESSSFREFVELLRRHGTVVDPTLNVFESMFTARMGEVLPADSAIAERLPPQIGRLYRAGGLPVPDGMDQRYRDSFRRMVEMVGVLHESGIPLVVGTDGSPGFGLHREMELLVEAGIPAGEVVYLATLGAARVMGLEKDTGSIEPGKRADLLLIDGDPTGNISNIRNTVVTIKDGVVFDADALYAFVGVKPRVAR